MSTGVATSITDDPPKWLGEPVTIFNGSASEMREYIPCFDRRPFALTYASSPQPPPYTPTGINELWDAIVRTPLNDAEAHTPVGIVSKNYTLVQHRELFDLAMQALTASKIKPDEVGIELRLTTYGSRMAVKFLLPERFSFKAGDKELGMRLILELFNSVDASSRLIVSLGWLRLVCMNGLMVGTSRLSQRFIHNEFLEIPDFGNLIQQGIETAKNETECYSQWLKTPVGPRRLMEWVDTTVSSRWGPLAAARTYLICTKGWDGKFIDPFEKAQPHAKRMEQTRQVPGSLLSRNSAYSVCQALAWIAKERRDIQEQLTWIREIPDLMGALLQASD